MTLDQVGTSFFVKKGSSKCIFVAKRGVPQSWGTSNGTFITDMVGDIVISFVEYLASKKVHLQPGIIECSPGDQAPIYDLIHKGKQTMHKLGVVSIGLPREDNKNRQDPPTHEEHCQSARITRALRETPALGGPLEKTLPRKKKCGKSQFFVQPLLPKFSQRQPRLCFGCALQFFSLCQFLQQDPVANNDTLAKKPEAKYLILYQSTLSRPLGHPDGGHDKVVFKLVYPRRSNSK